MTAFLQNAVDAISLGGLYALVALGIALIFGVMGFINFAHGELIMVGAYVLVYVAAGPIFVVIFTTVTVAMLMALAMERVAFRPLRGANPTTLLVTSFAVSFFLQNLARLTVGSQPKSVALPEGVSDSVDLAGLSVSKLAIAEIGVTLLLLVALWTFLTRTALGVQMRAAAEDFSMAQQLGVRASRVIAMAFAMSGILAGTVSLLFVAQVGVVSPAIGLSPALVGFVATVLGGMRSLVGATLGGFLLGVLTVAAQQLLPGDLSSFRDAFVFGSVIVMLLIRPQGLLGGRTAQVRV
jgi:branched-chain amino acid transport system permease protein